MNCVFQVARQCCHTVGLTLDADRSYRTAHLQHQTRIWCTFTQYIYFQQSFSAGGVPGCLFIFAV